MAERRMFHASVVSSDAFLDLPPQIQALYFHLGMAADDDGFVNGPRQIARKLGLPPESVTALIDAGFLLHFDGIVVLKHWRVANNWKTDRLQLPRYPEFARKIYIDENRIYTKTRIKESQNLFQQKKHLMQHCGIQTESEKKREKKKKEEKKTEQKNAAVAAIPAGPAAAAAESDFQFMHGTLGKGVVLLTQSQTDDLLEKLGLDGFDHYVQKLADFILQNHASVKNHYATILKWWEEDRRISL